MMTRSWALLASAFLLAANAGAVVAGDGEVRAVSLVPTPGRAELVIQVQGDVQVTDRTLTDPNRIVLDLAGATLGSGLDRAGYDGVTRAGVLNVRVRQYTPDVVRVVLDMEQLVPYRVSRETGAIRVSFGAEAGFAAWNGNEAAASTSLAAAPPAEVPAAAPRTRGTTPAGAEEAELSRAMGRTQQRGVPRMTVSWNNASIQEVIAGFQAVSGQSIIIGKGVTGTVTAEIVDRPWPEALYAILASQGLSMQEMPGGILRVDAPANLAEIDSLEPTQTAVVRVNYARVAELTNSLKGVLTPKRGSVTPDTATNSVIITDTKSNLQNVVDFVAQLDLRPKQVSIQAKIIFVDRTDLERLGFKYDIGSRNQFYNRIIQRPDPLKGGQPYDPGINIINLGGNEIAAIGNAAATMNDAAIDLVFSTTIGGFSITNFLQALEQVDLSDVQAEPTITTQDNKQATIRVGEDIPVRVIDANAPTAAGQAPRANVQFRETGIKLLVTPHVTNDGQISLDLATERSSLQTLAAADLGFIIAKQETKNQILVSDGETAVIGGLTVTTVEKNRTGIPLLSSLPLVGSLFSFSTTRENRKDLIILVTPRVLGDQVGTPPES
jgi:type IV pilus assembly protein PilQ